MKRRKIIILCICALLVCIFAGILTACGSEKEYNGVQVVYEFEGGTYKNGIRATHYYDLKPGAECLLVAPESVDADELRRPGYSFNGWYKTRTVDPETGEVTYSEPWDFEKDTINSETKSLTLYAAWKLNFKTYYEVCYRDEEGNEVSIAKYDVQYNGNTGSRFDSSSSGLKADGTQGVPDEDVTNKAAELSRTAKRECVDGVSRVCYFDENGEAWDPESLHPGDKGDLVHVVEIKDEETGDLVSKECTVKLFAEFEDGVFSYVSNASELASAVAYKENIVLLADVDFAGGTFSGFTDSNHKFGGVKDFGGNFKELYIDGNGHTIKNFKLGYNDRSLIDDSSLGKGTLIIGLFGMIDHVYIHDISFTDVSIDLTTINPKITNIYVAPLALTAVSSKIENVSFTGECKVTNLPSGFIRDNLVVERTNPVHIAPGEDTTIGDNVTVSLTDPA